MQYKDKSFSIEAAIIKGRALPEWYENEPDEHPGDYIYMQAFAELSTCRSTGFSLGPIPWRDIVSYGLHLGLDEYMMPAFTQIIRAMDDAYLKWQEDHKPPPPNTNQNRPEDPRVG